MWSRQRLSKWTSISSFYKAGTACYIRDTDAQLELLELFDFKYCDGKGFYSVESASKNTQTKQTPEFILENVFYWHWLYLVKYLCFCTLWDNLFIQWDINFPCYFSQPFNKMKGFGFTCQLSKYWKWRIEADEFLLYRTYRLVMNSQSQSESNWRTRQ